MKFWFLLLALFFGVLAPNLGADSVQDLKQSLSSSDAAGRATAMRNFVISLGTVNAQPSMASAIPVLVSGLGDPDVNVRRFAAAGLLGIASATTPVVNPTPSTGPNLTADPSTQKALLNATSDPDEVVRLNAIKAYAASYKLTPAMEDKIMAEFNAPASKTNVSSDKVAMIECLILSHSPSNRAQNFLTHLLDDPKYGVHVAERMGADNVPLSLDVLNKLVSKLAQDKDPVHRAAFARAIGAYGQQARPYAPQLQAALASENDEVTKANIRAAFKKTNR